MAACWAIRMTVKGRVTRPGIIECFSRENTLKDIYHYNIMAHPWGKFWDCH